MAENLLFATLDPTLRQVSLPGIDKAIMSDTVGFVSDLPTQLVAAFKATLEEVVSADLLIHVRDVAHPDSEAQAADVESVLAEIGVDETTPRIEAWNKLDLLSDEDRTEMLGEASHRDDVVILSALTGEGVDRLVRTVGDRLTQGHRRYRIALAPEDGASAAWLHAHGEVTDHWIDDDRALYDVHMAPADYDRFLTR
jgi:GTP-binding protein HflX